MNGQMTCTTTDPLKKSRVEDGILAFAWAHFLNHTDETNWIPRLPMVSSIVVLLLLSTPFNIIHSILSIQYYPFNWIKLKLLLTISKGQIFTSCYGYHSRLHF